MYSRILVTLEHSKSDAAILAHVRRLARHCGASVVLIHVADGWAARNVNALTLRESEEIRGDREYIERWVGPMVLRPDGTLAEKQTAPELAGAGVKGSIAGGGFEPPTSGL